MAPCAAARPIAAKHRPAPPVSPDLPIRCNLRRMPRRTCGDSRGLQEPGKTVWIQLKLVSYVRE